MVNARSPDPGRWDRWETDVRQRDATAASTHSAECGRILSPGLAAISIGIGAIAGLVPALLGGPSLSPLTGWIAAASVALLWVWRISWPQNAEGTKRLAQAESQSHSS